MADNEFDLGSALAGAAAATILNEGSSASDTPAPSVQTITVDNTDNSNPKARESYLNAFNNAPVTKAGNLTFQQAKHVVNTIENQASSNKKPESYGEVIISGMSKKLNTITQLRENNQDILAAKEFKDLQKIRSNLLSGATLRDPKNEGTFEFVKNMIVQGNDGAPASGVEATYQLHKFVKENPDATPEEFAKKLQQSQSIRTSVTKDREYPPVVEQDRSKYIQEAVAEKQRQAGVFIAPEALSPRGQKKPLVDPNAPPVLSEENEQRVASFASKIQAESPFTTDYGKATFNSAVKTQQPSTISPEASAKADEILSKSSIKWSLEGDEPSQP